MEIRENHKPMDVYCFAGILSFIDYNDEFDRIIIHQYRNCYSHVAGSLVYEPGFIGNDKE